jgi:hypothetical protein
MFGFLRANLFEAADGADKAPTVNFDAPAAAGDTVPAEGDAVPAANE